MLISWLPMGVADQGPRFLERNPVGPGSCGQGSGPWNSQDSLGGRNFG